MAKFSVTVVAAVILFLFSSTLSNARVPSEIPENDIINRAIENSRQESDVHVAIRFPSEKSRYEAHTHDPSTDEESKPEAATVTAVPLKAVRFRPINRHFRLRSSLPYRLCHHHHHHHHHHHQHHFRPMRQRDEIPYRDDVVFSTGENNDLDPRFFPGSLREVQPSWARIHHHHHHHDDEVDSDDDDDAEHEFSRSGAEIFDKFDKEKNLRKHFHHDEDEEGREKASKDDEKMEGEDGGGFLKHFRKFLNQFEF